MASIISPVALFGLSAACIVLTASVWISCVGCKNRTTAQELAKRALNRQTLPSRNEPGFGKTCWNGSATRKLWSWSSMDLVDQEVKQQFEMVFDRDGNVTGSTTDPFTQSENTVVGKMSWGEEDGAGVIMWRMECPSHTLEAAGVMKAVNGYAVITAQYFGQKHITGFEKQVKGSQLKGAYVLSVALPPGRGSACILTSEAFSPVGKEDQRFC